MSGRSRSPRRRGGRHQRFPDATPSDVPSLQTNRHEFDNELSFKLVKDWSWGKVSACHVQEESSIAKRDQDRLLTRLGLSTSLGSNSLRIFSALGTNGKYAGNCHRDLKRALDDPNMMSPFIAQAPNED